MYIHTAVCCVLCFQGGSLLADFASLIQESKERCGYTVSCMLTVLCFQGGSLLADFASLIQESIDMYIQYSCMLCVMFSGRFVAG